MRNVRSKDAREERIQGCRMRLCSLDAVQRNGEFEHLQEGMWVSVYREHLHGRYAVKYQPNAHLEVRTGCQHVAEPLHVHFVVAVLERVAPIIKLYQALDDAKYLGRKTENKYESESEHLNERLL